MSNDLTMSASKVVAPSLDAPQRAIAPSNDAGDPTEQPPSNAVQTTKVQVAQRRGGDRLDGGAERLGKDVHDAKEGA